MHAAKPGSISSSSATITTRTAVEHEAERPASPSLPREVVVHIAGRVDGFATLHTMAVTCKAWNAALNDVYEGLRRFGGSERADVESVARQMPLSPDRMLLFALSYLKSRLRNHSGDESPRAMADYSRRVVNLIGRQAPTQRAASATALFPILRALSTSEWNRLYGSVAEGKNKTWQDVFRLAATTHPNATSIFLELREVATDDIEHHREDFSVSRVRAMFSECSGDAFLQDGLFRMMLRRGERSAREGLQEILSESLLHEEKFTTRTLFRWLQMEPPVTVRELLLAFLLFDPRQSHPLPSRYGATVVHALLTCMRRDQCDGANLLAALCSSNRNLVKVATSDPEALKQLVRIVGEWQRRGGARWSDGRRSHLPVQEFFDKLNKNGLATPEQIQTWTRQDH